MSTTASRFLCALTVALASSAPLVRADVTTQQKTALDVASLMRTHGSITTSLTADKKRDDNESHCEGMMSMLCGNVQGGEIIRLDRDLSWHLEPAKKRYRETQFSSPAELSAMRAKLQANLEKMRSCPASRAQQPIDKSKCEMSPPKVDVHKTGETMSIAGHGTERTMATLTESCANKDTGDVCDTVIAFDLWLTQDVLPGTSERRAFDAAYARKLGLDDARGMLAGQAARFLAPYQAQIKQLADKSADFKGQPLKTSLRVLMGGPQCKSSARTNSDSAAGAGAGPSGANPVAEVAQVGKVLGGQVGQLMGGLFHKKKKTEDSPAAASAAAPGDAAPAATPADPYAQYVQLVSFSTETVNIDTAPIPASRFDIPADWTKEEPKAAKGADEEFTCPKT